MNIRKHQKTRNKPHLSKPFRIVKAGRAIARILSKDPQQIVTYMGYGFSLHYKALMGKENRDCDIWIMEHARLDVQAANKCFDSAEAEGFRQLRKIMSRTDALQTYMTMSFKTIESHQHTAKDIVSYLVTAANVAESVTKAHITSLGNIEVVNVDASQAFVAQPRR